MTETFASVVVSRFPRLAELLGRKGAQSYANESQWPDETALWQIERDIALLERYVPKTVIAGAYRNMLKNQEFLQAMYELRVAALLSTVARDMALHVPIKPANGNCDIRCAIERTTIFVEVTTRKDPFPRTYESGDTTDATFWGRVTVEGEWDPTSAGDDPAVRGIPASQELRETIQKKARQLPPGEVNVLVLGSLGGRSLDMEAALWGDEILKANSLRPGIKRERAPNGVFCLPNDKAGTSRVSALVWMKLDRHFRDVRVRSRLFPNPRAAHPLPFGVRDVLLKLFDRREILQRELERIIRILVEQYCPERIILFGSLVNSDSSDTVHQWSDIDLAVVKPTPLPFMERIREVVELVRPSVGVNIFVYTPEEVTRAEREGHFFIRDEILKRGRVLF